MNVTATDAKNRFGALCQAAKRRPVIVEKAGRPDTVLLSYAEYQRLSRPPAATEAAQRKQFALQHRDWIDEQNRFFDDHGTWSEGLTTW